MQVLADDGARVDALVDGRGDDCTVVLIHGFPLSREIWRTQFEALAKRARVVLPDMRGAGASSAPEGPYLMERLAADVAALLDSLGIERVAIAGHSMGGYVALAFARMFTERVTRLALVASRIRADSNEEAAARRALADRIERENDVEPVISAYLPRLFAPETLAKRTAAVESAYAIARKNGVAGMAGSLRGMALRAPAGDIAEDLEVPMLMVAGGADAVLPIEEARAVAGAFGRGRLAVCERSGHLPMLEEPELVTAALEEWLSE
ncbi:MAG TPA: alpha/beta hydrolase [Candidatus Binatia bacterium]|nr:alpha/beta hydrolase [Candidatus Binatia bacterium]